MIHLSHIPSNHSPWNDNFVQSESGVVLVEFSLALLPLLALLLLCVDVAWSIFARATLQNAAREGARFAVTGQILAGNSCLGSSIQQVVAQNSFGFVPPKKASSYVTVSYFRRRIYHPSPGRVAQRVAMSLRFPFLAYPSLRSVLYGAPVLQFRCSPWRPT